jgi:hypothetical protein
VRGFGKNEYDFTMALEPLLRDTEPASHERVRRLTPNLTDRVKSLQEKVSRLKLTHERPSDEISLKSPAVPVPVENPPPIVVYTEKEKERGRADGGVGTARTVIGGADGPAILSVPPLPAPAGGGGAGVAT